MCIQEAETIPCVTKTGKRTVNSSFKRIHPLNDWIFEETLRFFQVYFLEGFLHPEGLEEEEKEN